MSDVPLKVQAAIYIMAKPKLSLIECEAIAKDMGVKDMTFDLVGPTGDLRCRWIDPTYGAFEVINDPKRGAYHINSFKYATDIHCENLGVESDRSNRP